MKAIKDNQYWKDYNSKRREYIHQKNRERYLKRKGINTTFPNNTTSQPINTTSIIQPRINTTAKELIQPKLWADYYSVKKPYCPNCNQKGISETDYAFCSLEKEPKDFYFRNIYFCSVYHWTIYQGRIIGR